MIIDSHTHIFPAKIAAKALDKLSSVIHLTPDTNGTIDGLLASMEEAEIDLGIVLPIVTEPRQADSILRFASQINELNDQTRTPRLLSFAGIHPDMADYKEQLALFAREGFKGIKLHPNYQGVNFDDIRYMRILYRASELGLAAVTHTGADPYTPGQFFCSPDMVLNVLREVAPQKLILAHLGSNENYEEAIEKLCGQNVYLDTAYSLMHISEEQLVSIIRLHGADKILFGTDSPWTSQKECVEKLNSLSMLSHEEKQQILWKTAAHLLDL